MEKMEGEAMTIEILRNVEFVAFLAGIEGMCWIILLIVYLWYRIRLIGGARRTHDNMHRLPTIESETV